MELKNFLTGLFLIILVLILIIICYRYYVYNYCKNNLKCINDKLLFSLNKLEEIKKAHEDKQPDNVEGFFGGLSSWFSGSDPSNLPLPSGINNNEQLSILEKKINDRANLSTKFPPSDIELNGNSDDFKDSDNSELLNGIGSKPYLNKNSLSQKVQPTIDNKLPEPIFNKNNDIKPIPVQKQSIPPKPIIIKKPNFKDLLGSCQFYPDKCPDKYHPLGNFSINGIGGNSTLTCGEVKNTRPAHAIAQIKNNSIYEIHITDHGEGFNPLTPPKISIEGGKGHGATAEAVIDDEGLLKIIKIINPGYNYTETPNVLIDAPFMNSSCHLCCKNDE
jgi:hypothetical protein